MNVHFDIEEPLQLRGRPINFLALGLGPCVAEELTGATLAIPLESDSAVRVDFWCPRLLNCGVHAQPPFSRVWEDIYPAPP